MIAVDGEEYPYQSHVRVPKGRQIEACRWNENRSCATHWRLKPVATEYVGLQPAPIERELQAKADGNVKRQDAEFLKSVAANLTYNADKPQAIRKHRLYEIAMRIETDHYNEGGETREAPAEKTPDLTSIGLLSKAKDIQAERAREYEQAGGERSTAKIVTAFNAITGRDLRESEGWLFLQLLKMVRGEAKRTPHMDSIVDNVSYAALYGEARAAGR